MRGNVHTGSGESARSPLKRSIVGTYHYTSVKHLPACLDEIEWRFNNCENTYLVHDTLLVLLHGDTEPYKLPIERDDPGERERENPALIRSGRHDGPLAVPDHVSSVLSPNFANSEICWVVAHL